MAPWPQVFGVGRLSVRSSMVHPPLRTASPPADDFTAVHTAIRDPIRIHHTRALMRHCSQ